MATSGSKSIQVTSYDTLKFSWERTSYSTTDNTSTISWKLELIATNYGAIYSSASNSWSVTIDGEKFSGSNSVAISNNTTKTLASGTKVIKHNADGSKIFSYSFSQAFNITFSGTYIGTKNGSGSGTLNDIPRAATITEAPDFNDEENPTIKYSNPLGSTVSNIITYIAGSAGSGARLVERTDISATGSSYTFTLTEDERKALRKFATKNTVTVYISITVTINNTVYTDTKQAKLTIINNKPLLIPTVKDVSIPTTMLTGDENTVIKGFNIMEYDIGATAQKEATIVSQKVTCGNKSSTAATGELINVESNVFTFSIEDSRGNTLTRNITLNFVDYTKLTCNQEVEIELVDDTQAQVKLTIKGSYFSGNFGASGNDLWIKYAYSANNGDFGDWIEVSETPTIDTSNNTYTVTTIVTGLNYDDSYSFKSRVADMVAINESSEYTVKLVPVFDWGENDFNFNVPVTIQGNLLQDFIIEEGTEAMGSNGTWHWRKWRSGKAECWGARNFGNMAVTTAFGSLYQSQSFEQELPSDLFAATPDYIGIEFRGSNYGGWIAKGASTQPTSSSTGNFIVVRPTSATLSQAYISFNIIGRWK